MMARGKALAKAGVGNGIKSIYEAHEIRMSTKWAMLPYKLTSTQTRWREGNRPICLVSMRPDRAFYSRGYR
jgi:hypothetical protein